jgi:hypothetical protein
MAKFIQGLYEGEIYLGTIIWAPITWFRNSRVSASSEKADDRINVFTKAGLYAWNKWDYAGLLEFKSTVCKRL